MKAKASNWTISASCFSLAIGLWGSALAADPSERKDPIRGEWFKSLRTNPDARGNTVSCCDVSDGFKVDAYQQGDAWFVKFKGVVYAVPPHAVITSPKTIDGDAYAFFRPRPAPNESPIRCFVPPIPGF